ncbi:hypothetical protein BS47DRAFT_827180 [Hydnum rufescens UP504]|uniref:Uncharacterized protein n=1 Tax=Hydnum rufescens UP504 TaxID=1448309 RepID=A0A9P6DXW9_9AGAM|nr:hypothetical protein BS47DRAFT_827180 [Hydnum rufescens UP504]
MNLRCLMAMKSDQTLILLIAHPAISKSPCFCLKLRVTSASLLNDMKSSIEFIQKSIIRRHCSSSSTLPVSPLTGSL